MTETKNLSQTPYDNIITPTWCPGCGNFGILVALKNALTSLKIPNEQIVLAGDIGCASKLPYYVNSYAFCGLHGRVLPLASGIKLANHQLTVIAVGGDGGVYGEGGNHLLHIARRNQDITLLVHDNMVYSLTKGQTSPTSPAGFHSGSTPEGSIEKQFNPLLISLAAGASFVARGYSGDSVHLSKLIEAAITHPGFALVDILQPCVSFNHINDFQWYNQRIYKLDEKKDYDPGDLTWAMHKAMEWGEHIPIGIIFQEKRPTYEEQVTSIKTKPLVSHAHERIDISPLIKSMR